MGRRFVVPTGSARRLRGVTHYDHEVTIERRRFLLGGAAVFGVGTIGMLGGVAAIEAGLLPGRSALDEALGRCGAMLDAPDLEPGPVISGSFASPARRGIEVGWSVVHPPGSSPGDRLPVCLFLHGRGGSNLDLSRNMTIPRFLAAAVTEEGVAPFAIASVDGGDATNWHRRADGDDPPRMLATEFLPLLGSMGLDVTRVGLWGISLGGTGALYLATLDDFDPVGVVASSPALWRDEGEWQSRAYDDAADFSASNLWDRRDRLSDLDLRIDCGESDPFADRVRQFRDSLDPIPAGGIEPGCHDERFWSRQTPAQLAFLGESMGAATGR